MSADAGYRMHDAGSRMQAEKISKPKHKIQYEMFKTPAVYM